MKNYDFSCLQIGNTDLIGNKFNGHDLHLYLREKNIDANCFVRRKESADKNTFKLKDNLSYSTEILKSDLFASADIVHFHLIHATDFDITYFPIYAALKPTVITLHDPYFTTGHCVHSFGCEKWKTGCNDCAKLDIPFPRGIDTSALEFKLKKDAVQNANLCAIVASDYMENLVQQSPIWQGKKIYKVPFGINQAIFKPANDKGLAKEALGINTNNLVIMFRSTVYPFKGLETIKKALKNLSASKKITLITVEQKGLLAEFSKAFEIKEFGWVYDDEKLAKLYQAADLFLLPSEQEAFGMMAIEAMSCAVPVLSIKGTSLEGVTNAPDCGVCPSKEDFAGELNRLLNNEAELSIRADKSYRYAKDHYDKDVYIQRIIAAYQDVMKNHRVDEEWQGVLEQMQKYNVKNYTEAKFVEPLAASRKFSKANLKKALHFYQKYGLKSTYRKILEKLFQG